MCGIIGYIGQKAACPILLDGLQRLEYRGYDSAGVAVIEPSGELTVRKTVGKISALISLVQGNPVKGICGIGHTRWATHGKPSDINAHPHLDCKGDLVVIHNGIVENYLELKRQLIDQGHVFLSQTDTEVLPHLIEDNLACGCSLEEAVRRAIARIRGAHAIVVMSRQHPEKMIAARVGNAGGVIIGYGDGEMFIASDLPALLPYSRDFVFLSDMELATVTAAGVSYSNVEGKRLSKSPQTVPYDPVAAAKGGYKHFMLKEIMEQPEAVLNTLRGRVEFDPPGVYLEDFPFSEEEVRSISKAFIIGMGTSLHAAMVGRHMMEELARLPTEVDNASEFRYRNPLIDKHTLVISVAQSGETVDTLAAMDEARRKNARQVTVCNVFGSQATRIAEYTLYIRVGPEIGVCSTKTLLGSISALCLLSLYLGKIRGVISHQRVTELVNDIARLPNLVGELLEQDEYYQQLAHQYFRRSNFLFLGRGINYPIAMEGALKLKEVSYIHAEGYPAGEMKHGPIALIDENMPVVAIALKDNVYDKMISNIEEVKAREGIIIALATKGDDEIKHKADHVIHLPPISPLLAPLLAVVPLQLLAYHVAVRRGCDVDQPRNLAKTVTVE